jgi:hypothetical protein
MHLDDFTLLVYAICCLMRIRGFVRRGRKPLHRGPEWFLDVRVPPGFYDGPGKRILRDYRLRMFLPFLIEIGLAIAIVSQGRIFLLNLLILAMCAWIPIDHQFSVRRAEREASAFAIADREKGAARFAVSLAPRRLRDYTNWKVEWAIVITHALAIAWLIREYTAGAGTSWRPFLAAPGLLLYLQVGMLYVKRIIIEWRTPMPQTHAEEYLEAREQVRRHYLVVCDWGRLMFAAALLTTPIKLSTAPANRPAVVSAWLMLFLAITVVSSIWMEVRRHRAGMIIARTVPAPVPEFIQQSASLLCFEPAAPVLVLKNARGYSLNLANRLAIFGAVYALGLIGLFVFLRLI